MDMQQLKESLNKVDELHKQQGYESALKLVQELLTSFPYCVELLVKYAKLVQLIDKDDLREFPNLSMAIDSLKQAHLISPSAIEPCIELGYFEYAINDCPDKAIQYFNEAQASAESGLKEALIGQIKCYIDMVKISEAKNLLERAKVFFPDDFDDLEFDIVRSPIL